LTKAIRMVFVHVDGDVVSGMAACQPVVLVCALCCGRMDTPAITQCTHQHNRLTCRHTTDCVAIDVHKNHTYNFSQELGNSLKMVPA
jgi:hypothetical protein